MEAVTNLSDSQRDQGIRAMFAVLYAKSPVSADLAGPLLADTAKSATEALIESLGLDPDGWSAWLEDPEHSAAAESMISALGDTGFEHLAMLPGTANLLQTLEAVRSRRATNQAIAREYASTQQNRAAVIDLREAAPADH